MTRAEAIEILKKLKPIPRRADGQSTTHLVITMALDMAINSLKVDEIADGYISKSVIENIKAEITESQNVVSETLKIDKEDCFYNGKWVGFELALAIIDKHIGKENE